MCINKSYKIFCMNAVQYNSVMKKTNSQIFSNAILNYSAMFYRVIIHRTYVSLIASKLFNNLTDERNICPMNNKPVKNNIKDYIEFLKYQKMSAVGYN